ncbi:polynucleotide 5'-hydroxyl-kinase NOL9 isoform X2 [Tripterygium wilfordii]|uniref:polynucleotide 5'-hydroxyl-kinase NOL9 isoform X2 n=1 Tax=Tripterygium wilfordii TaxID=458696 RepID=UPI0018F842A6|nr:polynucleotide 5'-hydroxyl-kinase NOL9 isoform X2 [Tripterygium wilfordii]
MTTAGVEKSRESREAQREGAMASPSDPENSSANIYIPDEWVNAVDSVANDSTPSPPPIALVCGPKNSGKTTFSRYLLNVLLSRYRKVAYLDTDVGQSEFTTPGFLSLTVVDALTPDLAVPCMKRPERCFFFGDTSSKRDPTQYLKCIFALYDYYQKEYCMCDKRESPGRTELPLVVNTTGWVKGVGYDLLVEILNYIGPTHVVKIKISAESKNLPAGTFWLGDNTEGEVKLIEINSARQDSFNRSVLVQKDAHLLRDLRIMAYFRQSLPCNSNITTIKELANALAAHPPYEVPISSVKIRHLYCTVPSSEVLYSLNATIVGLAVSSQGSESMPWCIGLGIVRGVDTLKGLLYVLTPVPSSILKNVDLLLQGFIQIPTCLLQVQGCTSPYMSANVLPGS